jgi:hypothetical protein
MKNEFSGAMKNEASMIAAVSSKEAILVDDDH